MKALNKNSILWPILFALPILGLALYSHLTSHSGETAYELTMHFNAEEKATKAHSDVFTLTPDMSPIGVYIDINATYDSPHRKGKIYGRRVRKAHYALIAENGKTLAPSNKNSALNIISEKQAINQKHTGFFVDKYDISEPINVKLVISANTTFKYFETDVPIKATIYRNR